MRTGAAADTIGHFHETLLYESDTAFLEVVVPFLREGISAGEPVVVVTDAHKHAMLRHAIGADAEPFAAVPPS